MYYIFRHFSNTFPLGCDLIKKTGIVESEKSVLPTLQKPLLGDPDKISGLAEKKYKITPLCQCWKGRKCRAQYEMERKHWNWMVTWFVLLWHGRKVESMRVKFFYLTPREVHFLPRNILYNMSTKNRRFDHSPTTASGTTVVSEF